MGALAGPPGRWRAAALLAAAGTAWALAGCAPADGLAWPWPGSTQTAGLAAPAPPWPAWEAFCARFVQADGRVVDLTFDQKSTSEGQSYGLFFALVNNQRQRFDTLLAWTSNNLAAGELGGRLPAWLWGRRPDGSWGVRDQDAASDADLWLAYDLLEAGRLWQETAYSARALRLLALVRAQEVHHGPAQSTLLLPAPYGFTAADGTVRIAPAYLPGFLLARLALADPDGPWNALWDSFLALTPQAMPAGMAPDQIEVHPDGRVLPVGQPALGGADAIRVYLWAGLSGAGSLALARHLQPFLALAHTAQGRVPEHVDAVAGVAQAGSFSPAGFAPALLPLSLALQDDTLTGQLLARMADQDRRARAGAITHYYDQVLLLFGAGWHDRRYRFDPQGRLLPAWHPAA